MPLPAANIEWPPASTQQATKLYERWGAWYAGDPEQLAKVYADVPGLGGDADMVPRGNPAGMAARFVSGLLSGRPRAFWGQAVTPGQVRSHKVHVPLAGDIASTSADILYGEPPAFEIPDAKGDKAKNKATQQRLDDILEEANVAAVLLESGEIGSAYGGSFVRVGWDPKISPDSPLWDAIPPDCAVPEWRRGRLVAVTLWRELESPDGRTWRHLERHEPGRVLHGVYASADAGKLGRAMALEDHDETAPFALLVDAGGNQVTTGATGLACEYVPNMRPHRRLRGSPLGRSDYDGIEQILDALDETWTSWMRDLRLGKARLIVPRSYTMSRGRGKGTTFDPEREIFEAVDAIDNGDGGLKLEQVQFDIRVEEHSRTVRELTAEAVRGAGYSAQTFGQDDQVAATATEVNAREGRTGSTTSKKQLYAGGPLGRLARATLEIDAAKFGRKAGVDATLRPAVRWQDGVPFNPEATARTLQMIKSAEAASIHTRVEMLHPDWEEKEVEREVIRIKEEAGAGGPVAPPGSAATGGQGPDGPDPGDPANVGPDGEGPDNGGARPPREG